MSLLDLHKLKFSLETFEIYINHMFGLDFLKLYNSLEMRCI
jgi:hypothetical protein